MSAALQGDVVSLSDEMREVRIQALQRLLAAAMKAGEKAEAIRLQSEFYAAVRARSPEQVRRMEQAIGMHRCAG